MRAQRLINNVSLQRLINNVSLALFFRNAASQLSTSLNRQVSQAGDVLWDTRSTWLDEEEVRFKAGTHCAL